MAWFVSQSLVALALAFLLGLLLGWLAWSRRTVTTTREDLLGELDSEHRAEVAARDREIERTRADLAARTRELRDARDEDGADGDGAGGAAPVAAGGTVGDRIPAQGTRPAAEPAAQAVAVAVDEPSDELERIEGIGTKIASALREAGIRTFAQLADADDEDMRRALDRAGLRFAPGLASWRRQARLLADGDEPAFADLRAKLSGRKV